MALHPSRLLLDLHCPLAEPGAVTEGGECRSVPCGVVASFTVTCRRGSGPGGCVLAGSVCPSAGAGVPAAGPGCSVPAETGGPGGSVAEPPRAAGPVPSLPSPGPLGLCCGPESSAVPAGVPGNGGGPASVHSCPTAPGVGGCPVPAPGCGRSAGRGEGRALSGSDPRQPPRGPGPSEPQPPRLALGATESAGGAAVPVPAPVRQRSPAAVPRGAQGSAALRAEPVPMPRAGQSRAQHSTSTGREGKEQRAPVPGIAHPAPAPGTRSYRRGETPPSPSAFC